MARRNRLIRALGIAHAWLEGLGELVEQQAPPRAPGGHGLDHAAAGECLQPLVAGDCLDDGCWVKIGHGRTACAGSPAASPPPARRSSTEPSNTGGNAHAREPGEGSRPGAGNGQFVSSREEAQQPEGARYNGKRERTGHAAKAAGDAVAALTLIESQPDARKRLDEFVAEGRRPA